MSSNIGRNEPCPCGSGKKSKKCCASGTAGTHPASPGADEARGTGLGRASELHALDRALVEEIVAFGTGIEGWAPEEGFPIDIEAEPESAVLFFPWAAYEHRDDDGRSMADLFRAEHELSREENAWLLAQARARIAIWEVVAVTPGSALRVRHAFTGAEHLVLERSASQTLTLRSGILARIVTFEGMDLFCGMHPRSLAPRELQSVVATLNDTFGKGKRRRLDEGTQNRPGFELLLIELWEAALDELARRPLPQLLTTDGEELVPTKETFRLAPPGEISRVHEMLLALPHATPMADEGGGAIQVSFVRPNPSGSQLDTTVIGHATLSPTELVVETMSRERAAMFREQLERTSLVVFASREEGDVAEMFAAKMREHPSGAPGSGREVPPPEVAEAIRELKSKSYREWCDLAIPALDGKTPRQVMKSRSRRLRDELELLVRELEHRESKLDPSERFDVSVLRRELGLVEKG